jgi:predicted transcriptional regulator
MEDDELQLIASKDAINAEIEAGLAELDCGEGSTEQEVRAWMAEQKQAWRADHGR